MIDYTHIALEAIRIDEKDKFKRIIDNMIKLDDNIDPKVARELIIKILAIS
tara:strand:- start:505 stop:657 length:153 start_codon:yes stop_codon:yes gene_type:complete